MSIHCRFGNTSLVVILLILASAHALGQGQPNSNISISISPPAIQPVNGKLPTSVLLGVFEDDCARVGKDLNGYDIQITGSGVSLSPPKKGTCAIIATLTIDPGAPAGNYRVVLYDKAGTPSGSAPFSILDSASG